MADGFNLEKHQIISGNIGLRQATTKYNKLFWPWVGPVGFGSNNFVELTDTWALGKLALRFLKVVFGFGQHNQIWWKPSICVIDSSWAESEF